MVQIARIAARRGAGQVEEEAIFGKVVVLQKVAEDGLAVFPRRHRRRRGVAPGEEVAKGALFGVRVMEEALAHFGRLRPARVRADVEEARMHQRQSTGGDPRVISCRVAAVLRVRLAVAANFAAPENLAFALLPTSCIGDLLQSRHLVAPVLEIPKVRVRQHDAARHLGLFLRDHERRHVLRLVRAVLHAGRALVERVGGAALAGAQGLEFLLDVPAPRSSSPATRVSRKNRLHEAQV
mmetsp:Transcript_30004/g.91859  ORF Transcript_30004/g.91859 Transcript_30004/m.91859 type:complete len:238 (-) Transcript_30004:308-1021(-)